MRQGLKSPDPRIEGIIYLTTLKAAACTPHDFDLFHSKSFVAGAATEELHFDTLWTKAASWLIATGQQYVIDIGSGTGHLAHVLRREGWNGTYCGVDFSNVAVTLAAKRCPCEVFVNSDIGDVGLSNAKAILLIEVLQHIEDDIALLERIPSGTDICFSVSDIPAGLSDDLSAFHFRWFESEQQIRDRYKQMLDIAETTEYEFSGDRFWLVDSRKR
jgi:SAM-dependent methyltransferase